MSYLWILLFASLAIGAKAQGFDLADALDDEVISQSPIPKDPVMPKKPNDGGPDALLPVKPPAGDELDLADALGPDPEPKRPAVNPSKDWGTDGGSFGDSDLHDLLGGGDGYRPDKGKAGGRKPIPDSPDYNGGRGYDDGHTKDAGSMNMTTILSTVGVAIVGAITSYFAYKKRQRCMGLQGGNQRGGGLNIGGFGGRGGYGHRGNHPGGGAGGAGGAAGVLSNLLRMV